MVPPCLTFFLFFGICSMEKILKRYERYTYAETQLNVTESESQVSHSIYPSQNFAVNYN